MEGIISDKESKQIWDDRDQQWKVAYQTLARRLETISFVKDVLFDSDAKTYTSKVFECAPFQKFLLMIDVGVTLAPTDIQIFVQFSPDLAKWFDYSDGPFGSLMYESTAGDKKECASGRIIAHWMRVYVVSSGCNASNTFKLSVLAEMSA